MIDDFAIADDRIAAVRARDRLVPAGDVDDAQAAHAETEVTVIEVTRIVRAAVKHGIALVGQGLPSHRPAPSSVPAGDATHTRPHQTARHRRGPLRASSSIVGRQGERISASPAGGISWPLPVDSRSE